MKKCENCIEWEYFEGYGYGCFCMKTMIPIDANKCEFYLEKRPVKLNDMRDTDEANKEYRQ